MDAKKLLSSVSLTSFEVVDIYYMTSAYNLISAANRIYVTKFAGTMWNAEAILAERGYKDGV